MARQVGRRGLAIAVAGLLIFGPAAAVSAQGLNLNEEYTLGGTFPSAEGACNAWCAQFGYTGEPGPTNPVPGKTCLPNTKCKCKKPDGSYWGSTAGLSPHCTNGDSRVYGYGSRACTTLPAPAGFTTGGDESCNAPKMDPPPQDPCGGGGGSTQTTGHTIGNPVYPATGTKIEEIVDYRSGGAPALELKRVYSSSQQSAGLTPALGLNWRFEFGYELFSVNSSASQIRIALPTGRIFTLSVDSGGVYRVYKEQPNLTAVRVTSPTELFIVTLPDDEVVQFEKIPGLASNERFYRPISLTTRAGYQRTITYDPSSGQISSVSDNLGRTLSFSWTAGELTTIVAPGGVLITYTYTHTSTGSGALDTRLLETATITSGAGSETTTYLYENTALLRALTGIIDARGVRYGTYAYDAIGRVISEEHPGGADAMTFSYAASGTWPSATTVTNALGKQTIFNYQFVAGGSRLVGQTGVASANCPASATAIQYDSSTGRITQTTDEEGRVTKYVRDSRGLPTSITRGFGTPEAVTTTYTNHATFQVPTQMVEPGRTTDYTWDANGRLTQVTETDTTSHSVPYATNGQTRTWTYSYGTAGILTAVDGPLPGVSDTVSYAYNANGYLTAVTNEVGHVTQVTALNGRGQPTSIIDPNGVVTALDYDHQGRLITVTVNPGAGQSLTTIDYDAIGQITRITRPDGVYLAYTYSDARRLTVVTNNSGETITYTHDAMGNVTGRTIRTSGGAITATQTQTFDELGRLLQQIGAYGQTTQHAYQKNDNLASVTDPRGGVFSYAYDALNRLIRETDQGGAQVNRTLDGKGDTTVYSDPRGLQTGYVRNGFGDIIQETSPDRGTTVHVRDARGLVTQTTDARGVVSQMTYDAAGRMLARVFPSSTAENVDYTYDQTAGGNFGIGRLTRMDHDGGWTDYLFDLRGNITRERRVITGSPGTKITTFTFNSADRLTQITYPSGRQVSYTRTVTGRISQVQTRASASDPWLNVATTIAYRPMSTHVGSLTFGNGLQLSNTWSQDYELTRCRVLDGGTALMDWSYTRADALNITRIRDNLAGTNTDYTHDPANRLASAAAPWGTGSWTYDGVGNRTSETMSLTGGGTTVDTLDYPVGNNRVVSLTRAGQTVRSLAYDAAGNLVSDSRVGLTQTYTYNHAGRMATTSLNGSLRGTYKYNARHQLIRRVVTNSGTGNDGATHYVHDLAGNIIAEIDDTGATVREYIWLPDAGYAGLHLPLAVVSAAGTYYVHADHLSRPVRMTDAGKATVWSVTWDAWGSGIPTGPAALDARLPGQWFQIESGLHYNWHRQYDPSLGRYTQPDPLGFVDGPSLYGYGRGRPLEAVDPDGRVVKWLLKKLGLTIDPPEKTLFKYGKGRICQIRYKRLPVFRLDYDVFPGTGGQRRLHFHIVPNLDKHRCLDPRGCISRRKE